MLLRRHKETETAEIVKVVEEKETETAETIKPKGKKKAETEKKGE